MRYGVPYKGSKNSIAEFIYSFFPKHGKVHYLKELELTNNR